MTEHCEMGKSTSLARCRSQYAWFRTGMLSSADLQDRSLVLHFDLWGRSLPTYPIGRDGSSGVPPKICSGGNWRPKRVSRRHCFRTVIRGPATGPLFHMDDCGSP